MENEYYGIYLDDGLPSPSVEDTRRKLFEQHMSIPESVVWSDETKSYIGQNFWLVDYAWEAFNAALDAVEIELPSKMLRVESDKEWHGVRNGTISACQRSIESLNLGLKIK